MTLSLTTNDEDGYEWCSEERACHPTTSLSCYFRGRTPFTPTEAIVKLPKPLGVNTQIEDKKKLLDHDKVVVLSLTNRELAEGN